MKNIFSPLTQLNFYKSLLYSVLAFPLGILYFTALTFLITLGFGLVIVWVGIPILNFAFYIGNEVCKLENLFYKRLIDSNATLYQGGTVRYKIGGINALIQNFKDQKWMILIKSYAKLPLGIIYLFVNFFSIILSLIFSVTLLMYILKLAGLVPDTVKIFAVNGTVLVQNFLTAALLSLVGIVLLALSLKLIRLMANSTGRLYA